MLTSQMVEGEGLCVGFGGLLMKGRGFLQPPKGSRGLHCRICTGLRKTSVLTSGVPRPSSGLFCHGELSECSGPGKPILDQDDRDTFSLQHTA